VADSVRAASILGCALVVGGLLAAARPAQSGDPDPLAAELARLSGFIATTESDHTLWADVKSVAAPTLERYSWRDCAHRTLQVLLACTRS